MSVAYSEERLTAGNASSSETVTVDVSYIYVAYYVNRYVIPCVCLVGFLGNVLTMAVLTRMQLRRTASPMEKSANLGLLALAISDCFYCLLFLPNFFWPDRFLKGTIIPFHVSRDFWFYQQKYGKAISGTFVSGSTILTVSVAINRYIALCHPIRARELLGSNRTKVSILCSVLLALILNFPKFYARQGYFYKGSYWIGGSDFFYTPFYKWTDYIHFILSVCVPIFILLFCNIQLSRSLYQSLVLRRQVTSRDVANGDTEKHNRLTLTLIIIILVYFIGVAPQSILTFVTDVVASEKYKDVYYFRNITNLRIAISVLNVMEALALSLNFSLYCVVNLYFRKSFQALISTPCPKQNPTRKLSTFKSVRSTQIMSTNQTFV